jgi:hypothetical protein
MFCGFFHVTPLEVQPRDDPSVEGEGNDNEGARSRAPAFLAYRDPPMIPPRGARAMGNSAPARRLLDPL